MTDHSNLKAKAEAATAGDYHAVQNTDKHLWPITSEEQWPDTLHVTADGKGIGMNCGGHVIVKTMRGWHKAVTKFDQLQSELTALKAQVEIEKLQFAEKLIREMGASMSRGTILETLERRIALLTRPTKPTEVKDERE